MREGIKHIFSMTLCWKNEPKSNTFLFMATCVKSNFNTNKNWFFTSTVRAAEWERTSQHFHQNGWDGKWSLYICYWDAVSACLKFCSPAASSACRMSSGDTDLRWKIAAKLFRVLKTRAECELQKALMTRSDNDRVTDEIQLRWIQSGRHGKK